MKKYVTSFLIIFLFCFSEYGISSPPILFFKKSINLKGKKQFFFKYRIKEGDYIYSILRNLNIPKEKFGYIIKEIKRLNPNIKDLNKLKSGQYIKIPINVLPKNKPINFIPYKINLKKYPYIPKRYIIKKGDYVVELLKRVAGIPTHLIFNEYLYIFKRLNPTIRDIDNIPPGTSIILPIRNGVKRNLCDNLKLQKKIDLLDLHNSKKNLIFNILTKIGLHIIKDGTIIYPLINGNWISINAHNTPIVEDSFGRKIVLLYGTKNYFNNIRSNASKDIIFCRISSWEPYKVIEKISKYISSIKLWDRGKNLIIIGNKFVLESLGDIQVIKKGINGQNSYFIFLLNSYKITYTTKLLVSFLVQKDIHLFFLDKDRNLLISPYLSSDNILYLPDLNGYQKKFLITHKTFLQTIRLYFQHGKLNISINVRHLSIGNNSIYILDKGDVYLVALLRAKGYDCYGRGQNEF